MTLWLRITAARGFSGEIIEQVKGLELAAGEGIAGHVYKTGEPYYLKDSRTDPQFVDQMLPINPRFQFLSLPLCDDKQTVVGVLNIHFPTERILSSQDLEALRQTASELVNDHLALG